MNCEDVSDDRAQPNVTRRGALTATAGGLLATTLSATTATAQAGERQLWKFGFGIRSSPTVVDGTVFVGSTDNNLYAVNSETGEQQWSFGTNRSVIASPTVVDGTVFVGSNDNNLYAVDAETGEQQWAFETDDTVRSSPTVVGGTVFVGSSDHKFYAVDAKTGNQQWVLETDNPVDSSPTVVDGTVFFGILGNILYAVDAETGDQQWTSNLNLSNSSPTVADETVFIGGRDNNLYAVDAETGNQQWTFETDNRVESSPTVVDGTVFFGSGSAFTTGETNLYAVEAETGNQQWAFETGDDVYSSPTVVDETVFVGSKDNNLYAVDAKTGDQQWSFETGDEVWSSPTVVDGTVFVGSSNGLYAVDADTDGSSEGTRVMLGTLGHHDEWRYSVDSAQTQAQTQRDTTTSDGADITSMVLLGAGVTTLGGYGYYRLRSDDSDDDDSENSPLTTEADKQHTNITNTNKSATEESQTRNETQDETSVATDKSGNSDISYNATNIPEGIPSPPRLSLRYDNIEKGDPIGSGGNADVYRASAATNSDELALAIKEPRMSGTIDTETIEQLIDEAETWQQLDDHDHIVSVVDYGSNPLPWIGMEYMDGGDLSERTGDLSFEQTLWTALSITRGIRYAHKRGVAHLDLKPSNILFRSVEDAWDVPKVADWGLSKHLLEHSRSVEGMSPRYAAPEQLDSEQFGQTDTVTDVYQLGTVLYELFTGEPPFDGETYEVMNKIQSTTPAPPSERTDLPEEIDDILLTALSTERDDRYDDVILLRNALRDVWDDYK